MIIAPAKTLDLTQDLPLADLPLSKPSCDISRTAEIAQSMKKLSISELTKKLKISSQLGQTAFQYWQNFRVQSEDNDDFFQKASMYAYSGVVYQGLNVMDCTEKSVVLYLQENLRILSAVYGVLRPLDVMQPYRLEMGTSNVFPTTKLNQYWSKAVTQYLSKDLQESVHENPILLNLASDEYASTVNFKALPANTHYVKAIFQDEGRVIAVHAKRARGLMARYLADHAIEDIEGIRGFDREGYTLVPDKSDDTTLVFNRSKDSTVKKRAEQTVEPARTTKRVKK